MATICVTGAAGFIGSHLTEALLGRGGRVIGIDNLDAFYDPAVKRENLAACARQGDFTFVEGDIRDRELMREVTRGAEGIVHLAARAGVRPSIENPELYTDVNVQGTVVMLEAARVNRVPRFVFASSSSVYGNCADAPFRETLPVDHPISPYAATKRAGELLCHTYHHLHDLSVTCLRFFTVFGPRQRPDLAIHKFTRLIESGQPIPMFGDGSMERDHTYVDDIIAGTVAALDRCTGYRIYNLGGAKPTRLDALIQAIASATGKKATIERKPEQPGDVTLTHADVSRAREELGYEPATPLTDGLPKFVEWYRRKSP